MAAAATTTTAGTPPRLRQPTRQPSQPGNRGERRAHRPHDRVAFDPKDAVATAGKVTISAPNDGNVVHELVVLKTGADPAKLPMDGDEVNESANVGEIPDVAPGATKKVTIKLAAGKYAMVCNLPGHYAAGMYGSLTVK